MQVATVSSRQDADALDRLDPLAALRKEFLLPTDQIYLDGNSLGPLTHAVPARLRQCVEAEWGQGLVRSWDRAGWLDLPRRVGDRIGRLLGAAAGQVLVADSTSVNLFKLLAAGLSLRPERRVIVVEERGFPSDVYIAEGLARWLGTQYRVRKVPGAQLAGAADGEVAVVCASHVDYRTGVLQDLASLTEAAHSRGALALWDLSHSAGVVPVQLDACQADLAVGCGYKYLNGGPGAPAWLYVAERHQAHARQPLEGWFSHAEPFAFSPDYLPAQGIERFACGTPPILALAVLEAATELFEDLDMETVRRKSVLLGELFLSLLSQRCAGLGVRPASPTHAERRGAQVVLRHRAALGLSRALRRRGVVADCRPPDLLRCGFSPLFLRYRDVWDTVELLRQALLEEAWEEEDEESERVP